MKTSVLPMLAAILVFGVKLVPAALGAEYQAAESLTASQTHRDEDDHEHGAADESGHSEETDEDGAEHDHDADHEEGREVHLSPLQQETLGIETRRLTARPLGDELNAPGEVRLNAYATTRVTPRIPAQVVERHARLGEAVIEAQPLVTLSSVEMARAQGELVVAEREWRRVRGLGEKVVSERRFLEARVARQQARAKVVAYGMRPTQVDALLRGGTENADGSFQLLAPRAGTVISDSFILGDLVEPGRVLFEITDERLRWVEARMHPADAGRVSVDDPARVRYGGTWLEGRVIQIHHTLDVTTRTQAVRIEVPDPEHRLHPGVFVDVTVLAGEGEPVLSVPEATVLRSPDGDWQLFVAVDEEGTFEPVEVEPVRTVGGLTEIRGLPEGTEVVVRGAFFLQSELAKSGFDIHQH
jgi:RND family efflux transporter MFP subunit